MPHERHSSSDVFSLADPSIQREALIIQERIHNALNAADCLSTTAIDEQNELIDSVADNKDFASLFERWPPTRVEAKHVLESAGEEESIEDDCLQRYESFLSTKAKSHGPLRVALEELRQQLLSASPSERTTAHLLRSSDELPAVQRAEDTELGKLKALGEAAGRLNMAVVEFLDLRRCPFSGFGTSTEQLERRRLVNCEAALKEAVRLQENSFLAAKGRVSSWKATEVATQGEPISRRTSERDNKIDLLDRALLQVEHENTGAAVDALKQLQLRADEWDKKLRSSCRTSELLRQEAKKLSFETQEYSRAADALESSAADITELLAEKRRNCAAIATKLAQKTAERETQHCLLEDATAACSSLCERQLELEAAECTERKQLCNSEQAHKKLLAEIEFGREKMSLLKGDLARHRAMLDELCGEKQRCLSDARYLMTLAPDGRAADELSVDFSQNEKAIQGPFGTQNFSRFIQKARGLNRK